MSGFKGNGFTKLNSIFDIVTESRFLFLLQLSFYASKSFLLIVAGSANPVLGLNLAYSHL